MEVRLSPDSQARIAHFASESGCNANTLADEIIRKYFTKLEQLKAAVKKAEADFASGDFLTQTEVDEEVGKWIKAK